MSNFTTTLGWLQLGYSPLNTGIDQDPSLQDPVFYNKVRNYSFHQHQQQQQQNEYYNTNKDRNSTSPPISLSSDYLITMSPFSGPVAITLNQKKFLLSNKRISSQKQKQIRMYTLAGKLLAECQWPLREEILSHWAFDYKERLVCLMRDGTIILYSIFLQELNRLYHVKRLLDNEAILTGEVYSMGVVILSKTEHLQLKLRIVTNLMSENPIVTECASLAASLRPYLVTMPSEANLQDQSLENASASASFSSSSARIDRTLSIEDLDDSLNFPMEIVMKGGGNGSSGSSSSSTGATNPASGSPQNPTDVDILLGLPNFPSLLVVNSNTCTDMMLTNGPFQFIKARPGNDVVACYSENQNLWVVKSDFTDNETEFATNSKKSPTQVEWCGIHSVALYWSPEALGKPKVSLLLLIGPTRDYIKLLFDGPIHIAPEIDGLRILSEDGSEFLYRVPDPVCKVFKAGSLDPGAILYEANSDYENMDPSAVRNMRRLGHRLKEAVHTCIMAAAYEYDQLLQNRLMQAASLGKSFPKCKDFEHDQFFQMIKKLRVLNALRDSRVGMPLTYEQFELISPTALVDRLTNRFEHWLAFELCKFLSVNDRPVLMHWAQAKVCSKAPEGGDAGSTQQAAESTPPNHTNTNNPSSNYPSTQLSHHDQQILASIKSKIQNRGDIPFAQIAMTAHKVGKQKLAQKLLELEDSPGEKVSVLLTMNYAEDAFREALKSGMTDLIYMVLVQMIKSWPRSKLIAKVLKNETSKRLLETHALRVKDYALLEELYVAQEHTHDEGCVYIRQACNLQRQSVEQTENLVSSASIEQQAVQLKNAGRRFQLNSKGVQHLGDADVTRKQAELLQLQGRMDQLVQGKIFFGKSLSQTIYNALLIGTDPLVEMAQKLIDDFGVNPKRCCWIKVRALAEAARWEQLREYADSCTEKEGYPPIGFRPFAEECIRYHNVEESKYYISRVYDNFSKVRLYAQIEEYGEAINTAYDAKSIDMLNFIYKSCINPEVRRLVAERIDLLS